MGIPMRRAASSARRASSCQRARAAGEYTAADRAYERMASVFGTEEGSVLRTMSGEEVRSRMLVLAACIRPMRFRIITQPDAQAWRTKTTVVTVEVTRPQDTVNLPFRLVLGRGDQFGPAQDRVAEVFQDLGVLAAVGDCDDKAFIWTADGGLQSGLMMAQYTAASLVSDNKTLAHPDSVDSIPTGANQEDHVSMGLTSALKLRQIADNVAHVIAIELMAAAQGVDFRRLEVGEDAHLGRGTASIYARIRQEVPFIEKDTVMYKYIAAIKNLISNGALDALIA